MFTALFVVALLQQPALSAPSPTPSSGAEQPAPTVPTVSPYDSMRTWRYVALSTGLTADVSSTLAALGREDIREGNPLLAPIIDRPWAVVAVGAASFAITAAATDRLARKGHRRMANVIAFGISAVRVLVAAHNIRLARSPR